MRSLIYKLFQSLIYSAFTETGGTKNHNKNQSDGRTETIDSNIFKSGQSNVWNKTMKSQLVCCDAMGLQCLLIKCHARPVSATLI